MLSAVFFVELLVCDAAWADSPPMVPMARAADAGARRLPRCADAKDNDGDGLIDYPADPGCSTERDRRERSPRLAPVVSPSPPGRPVPPYPSTDLGVGATLQGRRPFPDDNSWNQDISEMPVDSQSEVYIASIGAELGLHPDFGTVWEGAPNGVPYVVVTGAQQLVAMEFHYWAESDPGPYPIPVDAPVQGGPQSTGDRHVIIVDRDNWMLYELWDAYYLGAGWRAGSGAVFNLSSNELRPHGWTSADAAGMPIFPGMVRYDEVVEQGEIRHALRFTVEWTRRAFVHPARHFASYSDDPRLPPMGMRVRLKRDVDISGFPWTVQVILRALKKYGMFVADNGGPWFITGAPDPRWSDEELAAIRRIKGRDLEVVQLGDVVSW